MTINFTFNSIDEMEESIVRLAEAIHNDRFLTMPEKDPEEPAGPEPEAEERYTAPMPEPETPADPEPEKPAAATASKTEKPVDRVQMRKILSQLNKKTGENTARKLISDMGYKVFTDVPDDRLAELKAKAEEVLNA